MGVDKRISPEFQSEALELPASLANRVLCAPSSVHRCHSVRVLVAPRRLETLVP